MTYTIFDTRRLLRVVKVHLHPNPTVGTNGTIVVQVVVEPIDILNLLTGRSDDMLKISGGVLPVLIEAVVVVSRSSSCTPEPRSGRGLGGVISMDQ